MAAIAQAAVAMQTEMSHAVAPHQGSWWLEDDDEPAAASQRPQTERAVSPAKQSLLLCPACVDVKQGVRPVCCG